jgi:hypothetical protein
LDETGNTKRVVSDRRKSRESCKRS